MKTEKKRRNGEQLPAYDYYYMKSNSETSKPVPLFLHIPKTAGTTLKHIIFNQHASDQEYKAEGGWLVSGIYYHPAGLHKVSRVSVSAKVKRALARDDLRAVTGHFSFGIHRFLKKPCVYLTILRHPVDRILSLYYHIKKYEGTALHEKIVSRRLGVEEFVLNLSCREADNDQTRRIAGLEPEFGHCSKATLRKAEHNLRRYFSVAGVTELFDETLLLMKRTLGWAHEPLYLPALVNKGKPARASLPEETIAAIMERNKLDLKLYEFARELLLERISSQDESFQDELDRLRILNREYAQRCAARKSAG
jgi:Sulfotransferase family